MAYVKELVPERKVALVPETLDEADLLQFPLTLGDLDLDPTVNAWTTKYCRRVAPEEWKAWTERHQDRGGKLEPVGTDFARERIFVLKRRPKSVPAFTGANSIILIIPEGMAIDVPKGHMTSGHNTVLKENGTHITGPKPPRVADHVSL